MATFKITASTTVAELKEQFHKEVGCVLRIYQGRSEAPDKVTLVSLGAKEGELNCRTSRTVDKFEEAFQDELNLKVKVYTKDNWVKVLDGITLAAAAELPNGMTKAKMEEYLSYQRDETPMKNDKNILENPINSNSPMDWNEYDDIIEVYKYMSVDDLADFLDSAGIKAKMCDASDFPSFSSEDLESVIKLTDGYCYCKLCSIDNSVDQWTGAGQDGHGVCVHLDVNYTGWSKASMYYSSLTPVLFKGVTVKDLLSIAPPSKNHDLKEVLFIKKAVGNDTLPYRFRGITFGANMTGEEHDKCDELLKIHHLSDDSGQKENKEAKGADIKSDTIPSGKENSENEENEEKMKKFEEEIGKVLEYDVEERIKKLFFEIVPDGTYIYSIDYDYDEDQKVAYGIDTVVCDFDANCNLVIKAVKFKVENGSLYAVECLNDDEDEISECFWNMDCFPQNYRALSDVYSAFKNGNFSKKDDITLIPSCDVEE